LNGAAAGIGQAAAPLSDTGLCVKPFIASTIAAVFLAGIVPVHAQGAYGDRPQEPLLRLSGSSEWEYIQSDGSVDGDDATTSTFGQRYTLDLSGFIWDPRFCRATLGLDFLRRNTGSSDNGDLDSDSLGYRFQSNFFNGRPFPLRFFARRTDLGVVGGDIVDTDRQLDAWGLDWGLRTLPGQNVRAAYERSSSDLLGPLPLRERRTTGLLNVDQQLDNGELAFHYGVEEQAERVNDVEFRRQELSLRDLTRFENGSSLRVLGSRLLFDALYTTGNRDELTTNRLSTSLDIPRGERGHYSFGYDFNQNEGRFLDSTNHGVRGQALVRIARNWQATGSLGVSQLSTTASGIDRDQNRTGGTVGIRYGREWSRFRLDTSYETGYTREDYSPGDDRLLVTRRASVGGRVDLGAVSSIFSTVSVARDDNDIINVGYTVDENRATLGWETRLGEAMRLRVEGTYRDLAYDTDNLGLQESDERGVEVNLEHRVAGVSARYRSTHGVSDFFPEPGSGSIFLPGTDLVSRSDYFSLGAHWRIKPYLKARVTALLDDRDFTTIGKERILSYLWELQYDRRTWYISAGLSHFERTDGFDYIDDTWRLRITKRFL